MKSTPGIDFLVLNFPWLRWSRSWEDEVWSKWYKEIDKCIVDDNDDNDMNDVMFIPADGY